jgi:hypothetical protein
MTPVAQKPDVVFETHRCMPAEEDRIAAPNDSQSMVGPDLKRCLFRHAYRFSRTVTMELYTII